MNSSFVSLALKLIGVIFILSSLLDFATLLIPPQWGNPQWQLGFATNMVDRGIVPMVGIATILIGYWIDNVSEKLQKKGFDLRLPLYILSILLGALFLLLVPLHLSNLGKVQSNALSQIERGSEQGKGQIQSFLVNLNTLAQNPQLLNKEIQQRTSLIESGQYQGRQLSAPQIEQLKQQKDQLQELNNLAKDPQKLKDKVDSIKRDLQNRLDAQKREAEDRAKTEAVKQGLRTGLSSLMLAIGYGTIGALGWLNRGGNIARPKTGARL
jgi:hypothetical protein